MSVFCYILIIIQSSQPSRAQSFKKFAEDLSIARLLTYSGLEPSIIVDLAKTKLTLFNLFCAVKMQLVFTSNSGV